MSPVLWLAIQAAVLHVSPSGPSDGVGSVEKPLRTVEKAMALAKEGDTIQLVAGNHALTNTLVVAVPRLRMEGGFDAAFEKRDPFGTPSWIVPAAGPDRPVIEVQPRTPGVVIDGLAIDGGGTLSYVKSGLGESSMPRYSPLIRVVRGEGAVVTNCTLLNAPGHAVSTSVISTVTVQNNVIAGARVSAITGWGARHEAKLVVQDNTIVATWAEKLDGTRGDGVDVQSFVQASIVRNVIASVQGTCVRFGRGLPTPVVTGNLMGPCRSGAVVTFPTAGPSVSSEVQALESITMIDAKGNRAGPLAVEQPVQAYFTDMFSTPDAGPRIYAPRVPVGWKLVGLVKDAGAQPFVK